MIDLQYIHPSQRPTAPLKFVHFVTGGVATDWAMNNTILPKYMWPDNADQVIQIRCL